MKTLTLAVMLLMLVGCDTRLPVADNSTAPAANGKSQTGGTKYDLEIENLQRTKLADEKKAIIKKHSYYYGEKDPNAKGILDEYDLHSGIVKEAFADNWKRLLAISEKNWELTTADRHELMWSVVAERVNEIYEDLERKVAEKKAREGSD